MMNFSHKKPRSRAVFRDFKGKKRQGGAEFRRLLAPKRASRKALPLPVRAAEKCSNIGSEIKHCVEQHAGPGQHALDLVGSFGNRVRRGIERKLACLRWLVIVADPRKGGE